MILSRLPFATGRLWEWDSVLYAAALEQGFHVSADLAGQRPHPPGYVFYVASAAILRWVFKDSNAALVAISVLASGAAAAAIYLLARRLATREIALFVAVAFAVNPLVWAHSEVALPYSVLALGSAGLALLFWDARQAGGRRAIAVSLVFGIVAGFRQDLLLTLGPLWLWSVAGGGPRRIAWSAAALAIASLTWFVPSAALSGGVSDYLGAVIAQSGSITSHSVASGQFGDALWYDVRFILLALAWGLFAVGVLLLGLLIAPALHWVRRPRVRRPDGRTVFFLLWLLPGIAVYALWIIGDWGYVLSLLPGLYVLCASLLGRVLARGSDLPWPITRGVPLALLAATVLVFVLADARWSKSALAAHDATVSARVAYIRGHFEPGGTTLLAREDYQLARYYLTEYAAWLYDPAPATDADPPRSLNGTLVIFTPDLELRQPFDLQRARLADGGQLRYAPATTTVRLFGVAPIAREP